MDAVHTKKQYRPPALTSVKVFLPPLLGTTPHGHIKKPFRPFR